MGVGEKWIFEVGNWVCSDEMHGTIMHPRDGGGAGGDDWPLATSPRCGQADSLRLSY